MKNIPWSHYQLFLSVCRNGGLSGAAAETGLSPATLGRHMLDLERLTGRSLFLRSQAGYRLTADGERLQALLGEADGNLRRVDDWRGEAAAPALVRLAIGTWNAFLVSAHINEFCREGDTFRLQFLVGEARANLAHRENDIGIRSFEPEELNLASIRLCSVAYAPFRAKNAPLSVAHRWLAVTQDAAVSAYLRWPHEHHAADIVMTASRPRSVLDLAEAGAGIAVLPCFIGDVSPRLERAGPIIEMLTQPQWLVTHEEDRYRPEIRIVADRLMHFIKARSALYAGRRAETE
ncbi:LysR family transcriptional regulator [Martelella endophytica]|uniref:LysR family transcriptional regulator n=1 Tax=Martelella endophytica TaxID=1486262 RepID=A0A0D5LMC6_MAREN|nr:LysR family transcriptional regulator [Martelella endophytica]AJY44453.1 LysR family transcriptional regulator [Martelella endophytica]